MRSVESGEILYVVEGGIANITINRPNKMNALNSAVVEDLYELFCQIDVDESIRAVVIRGAGDKAFVAGADIAEVYEMKQSFEFRHYIDINVRLFNKMMQLSQPIIAAVDGYAFGGGCAVTLASDMVVATQTSAFGTQEINMGFVGNGSSLTKLVGKQKAAELTMLGGAIDAAEAHRMMLVNQVVPDKEAMEAAVAKICKGLIKKSYYALKMAKRVIYNSMECGVTAAGAFETDAATVCFDTPQCKAALDAFVNKK